MAIKCEVLLGCQGIDNGGMTMCVCSMAGDPAAYETYTLTEEPDVSKINDLNNSGVIPNCPRGGQRYLTSTVVIESTN